MERVIFTPAARELTPERVMATSKDTAGAVIHFVGLISEEMQTFMRPALRHLASRGVPQILITPEQSRANALRREFGDAVHVVYAGRLTRGRPVNWMRMIELLHESLRRSQPRLAHFYGAKAWMLGANVLSSNRKCLAAVYSPHGSHAMGTLHAFARLLAPLVIDHRIRRDVKYVATTLHEKELVRRIYGRVAVVAECHIDPVLFDLPADSAGNAELACGGDSHNAAGFDMLVRLAVKLRGVTDDLKFSWLSGGNDQTQALLKAAQIRDIDSSDIAEVARVLSRAWFYVETTVTRGFPVFISRAMSMAVPCIAPDTPSNREIIEHGRTGLLYHGEAELIRSVGLLLQDEALRTRMGHAARVAARAHFRPDLFSRTIDDIYSILPAARQAQGHDEGGAV